MHLKLILIGFGLGIRLRGMFVLVGNFHKVVHNLAVLLLLRVQEESGLGLLDYYFLLKKKLSFSDMGRIIIFHSQPGFVGMGQGKTGFQTSDRLRRRNYLVVYSLLIRLSHRPWSSSSIGLARFLFDCHSLRFFAPADCAGTVQAFVFSPALSRRHRRPESKSREIN